MSESYQYLRVRVQVEQQRFLSFAMEAGLLYDDNKICATLQVNHTVLEDVLIEIRSLFQTYEDLNGKYESIVGHRNVAWNDKSEPQTNLTNMLCVASVDATGADDSKEDERHSFLPRRIRKFGDRTVSTARKLRTVFAEPRRLVWVRIDQEGFKVLVDKLNDLNSFLIGLLDTSHAKKLEKDVEMSYLELLQLRNDVRSLGSLIEALDWDTEDHRENPKPYLPPSCGVSLSKASKVEREADGARRQYVKSLARLKIRHVEIDHWQGTDISASISYKYTAMSLDFSSFTFSDASLHDHDPERRSIASWDNRSVWIEWVQQSPHYSRNYTTKSRPENRVLLLTRLLCEEIPPGFRSPRCLGYVTPPKLNEKLDFGMVFESPSGTDIESNLTTLRQLLGSRPKPSVTARVSLCSALADCLFGFHSVDWLHKGLRSNNILFFGTKISDLSLDMPYITGYDLSRPSYIPEMTEKPPFDPFCDIYRHPHAQCGRAKKYYRKSYDMYSLGIILLEIALWKPIEIILEIGDLKATKPRDLRSVQQLLGLSMGNDEVADVLSTKGGSECLAKVARKCGDSYRDVVEICLGANEVENPAYRGESHALMKSRLRTMFKHQVVERLRSMKEALSSSN